VVDVLGGGAQPEKGRSGRTLLRIAITPRSTAFAIAKEDALGGREADAEGSPRS
jgi:hypothetical protein